MTMSGGQGNQDIIYVQVCFTVVQYSWVQLGPLGTICQYAKKTIRAGWGR